MSTFTERLCELMSEEQLTVTELAKRIGVCRATVSGIINGAHMPDVKVFIALANFFNLSADYLLCRTDTPCETKTVSLLSFDSILKKCLKESGKSEYRMRKDLNISSSLSYRWLSGKAIPTVESLIKLADYFGCSVDYLLGRES